MRLVIANSALRASLAIYHLISNARSWNNCQISNTWEWGNCCVKTTNKYALLDLATCILQEHSEDDLMTDISQEYCNARYFLAAKSIKL